MQFRSVREAQEFGKALGPLGMADIADGEGRCVLCTGLEAAFGFCNGMRNDAGALPSRNVVALHGAADRGFQNDQANMPVHGHAKAGAVIE